MEELSDIIGRYVRGRRRLPPVLSGGLGLPDQPAPPPPLPTASFGHCLDYENSGFPLPLTAPLPACRRPLALGEQHHASGKTIITAYTLGWENPGTAADRLGPRPTAPGYHPPRPGRPPWAEPPPLPKPCAWDAAQNPDGPGHCRFPHRRPLPPTPAPHGQVPPTPGNAARMGAESAILAGMGYTASDNVPRIPRRLRPPHYSGAISIGDAATGGASAKSWRLTDPRL